MKKRISTGIMIFVIGLSLLLYPGVSNFWNSIHQTYAIVDYEASLEGLSPTDYTAYWEAAEDYNRELAGLEEPLKNYDQIEGYKALLNVRNNGMMGYITIPDLNVELPIYHGTSESVLSKAAGHLEGSSLPVGGENTHCVISAHRGLPSAKLFTNLDQVEVGDSFSMKILDRTLAYEVFEISVVKPDEIEKLGIEAGKDLCTLVTCTPYGINSHRLLVHGKRTEAALEREVQPMIETGAGLERAIQPMIETEEEVLPPNREIAAGIALVILAVLVYVFWKRKRKRKT